MPNLSSPFISSGCSFHIDFSPSLLFDFHRQTFETFGGRRGRRPTAICAADRGRKEKVVVILGATGSGKSRLSVDLGGIFPAEIINSDKMQVYNELTVTTNQISLAERRGVPHHLIGDFDPYDGDFTAADFRSAASESISGILSSGKLPIVAGGSNSFVHALLAERFDPNMDPFSGSGSVCRELRYDCCFIWVDEVLPVLLDYLSLRVDEMLELGMFEDLAEFYDPKNDSEAPVGLWKAIGVPEFNRFFKQYPPEKTNGRLRTDKKINRWDKARKDAYERAVREIKENTWQLVKRQLEKIQRLRAAGWNITRIDATASFRAKLLTASEREDGGVEEWGEIWKRDVLEPSVKIVERFLED